MGTGPQEVSGMIVAMNGATGVEIGTGLQGGAMSAVTQATSAVVAMTAMLSEAMSVVVAMLTMLIVAMSEDILQPHTGE